MTNIINKILSHKIFEQKPIVLIHIGADGSSFFIWKKIAKKSILESVDPTIAKNKNKHFIISIKPCTNRLRIRVRYT